MTALYVEKPNELLMDLDAIFRRSRESNLTYFSEFFIERLLDARDDGLIAFHDADVWVVRSFSEKNRHAYIRLQKSLDLRERLAWQAWFAQDWNKSRCDAMREARGIPYCCLLDEPQPIGPGFWRGPDAVCACPRKHESEVQARLPDAEKCPVWVKFRGQTRYALFGTEMKSGVEYRSAEGRQPMHIFERQRQIALARMRARTKSA